MNKKGFTLIEIVAVIVILGIIMLIAVPSVTQQIMMSRKGAYVTNVKSFLESADNSYRELDYGEYLEDKEIIVAPLDSLKMDAENLQKSPFAAYDKNRCYIVITPTKNNFKSYAIFRDIANYGVFSLASDDITKDSIRTTESSSIQSVNDFYECNDGEVTLITNKSFVFKGLEFFATDFELTNSSKCDDTNRPVIRFSSSELENGDVYTINYDGNTGEGVMDPTECIFGRDCTLSEVAFTKIGYHFTKWTKNKNGRGVSFVNKQVVKNITLLDHVTLFAQWAINYNTLVVNANGGTGGGTWRQKYNTTKDVDVNKVGHTFKDWSVNGDCGTYSNTSRTTYTFPTGNETTCKLTANWDINNSVLVVDASGGSGGGTWSQNYNTIRTISVTRTGYTFNGWDQSGVCGTYTNNASTSYTYPADSGTICTLKAKWKINTSKLVVNANGGTGGFSAITQNFNTTKEIAVVRTGYTFNGWDATGTCGIYGNTASTTYTFPADNGTTCTLKAKWKINTSKLVVNDDGGTGGFSTVTQDYNTTKSIAVSKTGHTFDGWTSSGICGTYGNAASTTYTFPADNGTTCTLKAKWKINSSSLTVNANGGDGSLSAITQNYNTTMNISVTRTGYTFNGWDKTGTCGTYANNASTTYTFPANNGTTCTLKAKWTAKTFKVSFNANGGSGGQTADVTATYAAAMPTITTTKPTRSGYKFEGWYDTSAATGGTQYYTAAGASARNYDKTSNTTLYARWTIDNYTLTYNSQGGSACNPSTKSVKVGNTWGTLCSPTKTDYKFSGWYTKSGCSGTNITASSTASSNITVHACWKQVPSVTVSKTSLTITPEARASCGHPKCSAGKGSVSFNVTNSVAGTYTFSASPNIVTASINNKKVTVTQKTATGTAQATTTLTVTFTPNNSNYATVTKNIGIKVNYSIKAQDVQGGGTPCDQINSTRCNACRITVTADNGKTGTKWGTCTCD